MTYQPEWWPPKWEEEINAHYKRYLFMVDAVKITLVDYEEHNKSNRYWVYALANSNAETFEADDLLEVYCWLLARDPANPHREDIPHAQEPDDP